MLKKLFIPLLLASSSWAAKAPNFVVVYVDDLGWAQTSVEMIKGRADTKSDFYQTKNLERLAATGQVLSACYSPSPICAASRNSLLHGMTPSSLGYTTLTYFKPEGGHRGKITIPKALKKANPEYVTAHFGKWHNDRIKPDTAGYDVTDGNNGNGPGDYADDRKSHLPDDDPKRIISLTSKTKNFMKDQVEAGKPFYVQLSHYAMHIWHDSFQETRDKYKKLPRPSKAIDKDYLPEEDIPVAMRNHGWIINYAAMIEDVDTAFGDLLDELDRLGIADNTYVLFTGDNGGGFRGNKPLIGGKGDLLEGGIRLPSFVRGPGIKPGTYNSTPMVQWDFLQTFYDLAGGTEPLPAELDGGSLKDVWFKGDAGKVVRNTPELIFHFPWHTGQPESVVRIGDYKLIKDLDTLEFKLFNLKEDLGESKNLASQMPEKVAEMDKVRSQYLDEVKAETVTVVRRNYLGQLEGGWIESGKKRLAKLKAEAAADPTNKQKAFHVDVSTNHVNFQDDPKRIYSLIKDSTKFVEQHAGKRPFFMMVSHYAVHVKHKATQKYMDKWQAKFDALPNKPTKGKEKYVFEKKHKVDYAAMLEEADQNLGFLMDILKEKGELDNTYIIFTSDNGSECVAVDDNGRRYNGPLQEGKYSCFEGGIRVPFLVSGPGVKPGAQCDVPVVQWDLVATLHDLSGNPTPLPKYIDGGSLDGVFRKGNAAEVKRRAPGLVFHFPSYYQVPLTCIRIGDYKFMRNMNTNEVKLFNVKDDYAEKNDLAESMPEKTAEMDKILRDYIKEVDGRDVADVYQAQNETLDEFERREKMGFPKRMQRLIDKNPSDLEAQKAKLQEEHETKMRSFVAKRAIVKRQATWPGWYTTARKTVQAELGFSQSGKLKKKAGSNSK